MMVMKVLYNEKREERKQLLDDMVIGTPEAFPLPQLTQVKAFPHTTEGQASCPPLPCLQPLGPSSSSSLCSSQQLVVPEFTCQCLKTKNSAECTCYQCLKTKILQNALVANAQTQNSAECSTCCCLKTESCRMCLPMLENRISTECTCRSLKTEFYRMN